MCLSVSMHFDYFNILEFKEVILIIMYDISHRIILNFAANISFNVVPKPQFIFQIMKTFCFDHAYQPLKDIYTKWASVFNKMNSNKLMQDFGYTLDIKQLTFTSDKDIDSYC